MARQEFQSQELKESINKTDIMHLAGIVEAGASIRLHIYQHRWSFPEMSIGDKREKGLHQLKDKFGVGKTFFRKNTWEWYIYSQDAISLLELIEPYAPFRQEYIQAFRNWDNAESASERLEIATDLRQFNMKRVYPEISAYRKLVEQPALAAGIYDVRGRPSDNEKVYGDISYTRYEIIVQSRNRSLLQALKIYGGEVYEFEPNKPLWYLMARPDIVRFLTHIHPYLVLQKDEVSALLAR